MPTPDHNLSIDVKREGQARVVTLAGEIDLRTSPTLHARLLEEVESRPQRIILDLSGVTYVDSSGVGTMVDVKRQTERRGGKMALVGLQSRVKAVFEVTRLDNFFEICDSLAQALKP